MSDATSDFIKTISQEIADKAEGGITTSGAIAQMNLKHIATFSVMLQAARTSGSLKDDDEQFQFFREQLRAMVDNACLAVAANTILTVEQCWNILAKGIREQIGSTLDLAA